mmetsp:Transcript_14098/g.30609  ORF Transcript_14098/g.30609 Transcript_14098/m.30609 type:complete len:200 (+) Transcript_14098:887-1486(+)
MPGGMLMPSCFMAAKPPGMPPCTTPFTFAMLAPDLAEPSSHAGPHQSPLPPHPQLSHIHASQPFPPAPASHPLPASLPPLPLPFSFPPSDLCLSLFSWACLSHGNRTQQGSAIMGMAAAWTPKQRASPTERLPACIVAGEICMSSPKSAFAVGASRTPSPPGKMLEIVPKYCPHAGVSSLFPTNLKAGAEAWGCPFGLM